jgi:D-beta-D-heptose 7-phosphate kinase/D-beta-D-heptose 1-phosphate adenosyltransferase
VLHVVQRAFPGARRMMLTDIPVHAKAPAAPERITELTSAKGETPARPESKMMMLPELLTRVAQWRTAGLEIVFTNGCFDLLHIGHVVLLDDARRAGDRLIVGINSDSSTSRLKGPTRPIVPEQARARVLAALEAVDAVIIFDEPTPLELMIALRPDVIVKGGDYVADEIVGSQEVRSWGGQVKIVPFVKGFSTTTLAAKAALPEKD